jgi:pyruvate/2-oxoglutarate/acetoin dehydrogenase E1 component/pyruvate/2-oxoglutarate dehydrogenase complex dihydrolipoamide acyltransferase (E2) component
MVIGMTRSCPPRVAESLNAALHRAFVRHSDLFLLGQDVCDPYGGAFGITRGLSNAHPTRVLSTPISENATMGVASGLAMTGHRVIVEVMFGDFLPLAFDQILNFLSKTVSMYGVHTPMRVLIRCPVGGRRGYGPTHSQSPQKHFIGIPHLALYELSPFHDMDRVLAELLDRDEPSILFEDKVTYTERGYPSTDTDERYLRDTLDCNWIHLYIPDERDLPSVVLIASGGVARRALAAASVLAAEDSLDVHILIPVRLYPVEVEPILELITAADGVWVVEESTPGGTWGSEIAARVHDVAWSELDAPVRLISSGDSVIPAALHLEKEVLLQAETIIRAVRAGQRSAALSVRPVSARAEPVRTHSTTPTSVSASGAPVTVPKVNTIDDSYTLVRWLVDDGRPIQADQPVVEVETSKAIQELTAPAAGLLRHAAAPGTVCRPGDTIGHIADGVAVVDELANARSPINAGPQAPSPQERSQRRVAELVTRSRREIPAAFTAVRIVVDHALELADRLSQQDGAAIGLTELVIKALGALALRHPEIYRSTAPDGDRDAPSAVGVAVTVDVDTGLYLPVVTDIAARTLDQIADVLTRLRMCALRGSFTELDFAGATIALSLNVEPGITLAQPIIPPGLATIVSLAGPEPHPCPNDGGPLRICSTMQVGLTYDHRYVNGRHATQFLIDLKHLLEHPTELA